MALGFAAAISMCVPAPASAASAAIFPACSARTVDPVTAEGRCSQVDLTYEFRIVLYCDLDPFDGNFFDYTMSSQWRPTNEVIRISCLFGGWIVATSTEVRPARPV